MTLVVGATGFVGRGLVERLSSAGMPVRAMVRHPGQADAILGTSKDVELVRGDLLESGSIMRAVGSEDTIVYLASSLASPTTDRPSSELDTRMMSNLCRVLAIPNPPRVIYLSHLCDATRNLQPFLESRIGIENILVASGVPYCIFRSAPVLGRWGIAFRLLHTAIEKRQVVFVGRGSGTPCQPIFVGDVVSYLTQACTSGSFQGRTYEIAGNDVISYLDMLELLTTAMDVSRTIVPLPTDISKGTAKFLARYTGIPLQAVAAFLEGMNVPILQTDRSAHKDFPAIHPMGYLDAINVILREL